MPSRELLQLIVNADDFGQSDDTVEATIECFEAGALTSATFMPGMPATERALEFARAHPELGFGVHLTFSADPARRRSPTPSSFRRSSTPTGRCSRPARSGEGAHWAARAAAARAGDRGAGARRAWRPGVPVSHVDSHRHLHKFAPVRAALASVLPRLGIRRVRARPGRLPEPAAAQPDLLARPSLAARRSGGPSRRPSTSSCRRSGAALERSRSRARSQRLEAGSLEVGVHPGRAEDMARPRPRLRARARSRRRRARPARRLADARRGSGSLAMARAVSVVIPARDAAETIGGVLEALAAQDPPPAEVIVVDDASQRRDRGDRRAPRARRSCGSSSRGRPGGARNRGWEEAGGEAVVFLDADAVPAEGWAAGLQRALDEFPGAVVACARTFTARTRWGWVAHLQFETPYLPQGEPARAADALVVLPRRSRETRRLRWHESYGGEDGLFSVDALAAGLRLVFDPRFHAAARPPAGDASATCAASSGASSTASPARRGLLRRAALPPPLAAVPASLLRLAAPARDLRPRFARDRAPAVALPAPAAVARRRRVAARGERAALRAHSARPARAGRQELRVSGKPILVTGAHRSGTTWVGKMLALAPGVAYLHEPFSPTHPERTQPGRLRSLLHGRHDARTRRRYRAGLGRTLALALRPRSAAALAARSWRDVARIPRDYARLRRARGLPQAGRSSRTRSRCSRPSGWPRASGWTWSC